MIDVFSKLRDYETNVQKELKKSRVSVSESKVSLLHLKIPVLKYELELNENSGKTTFNVQNE
jgi:hypothetical protein